MFRFFVKEFSIFTILTSNDNEMLQVFHMNWFNIMISIKLQHMNWFAFKLIERKKNENVEFWCDENGFYGCSGSMGVQH